MIPILRRWRSMCQIRPITEEITFKKTDRPYENENFKTTNFSLGGVICGFLFQNFKSDHKERKSVGHYQNNLT